MIGFYLQEKDDFAERARYVFRALAKMIGVKMVELGEASDHANMDALLIYGSAKPGKLATPHICIARDDYARAAVLTPADVKTIAAQSTGLPEKILYLFAHNIDHLPATLYVDADSSTSMISRDDRRAHCAVDIIATCFYFLSLGNERRATDRDRFQRYQKNYSPLGEEIYDYPVVDRYAALLRALLLQLNPHLRLEPIWPENKDFAVALSHDVDRIQTWTLTKARRAMRASFSPHKNKVVRSFRLAQSLAFPENWLGNFSFISKLEQHYGAASTFFVVSTHRHELDPIYKLDSPRIRQGLETVQKRGCDIALHGSIPSASNNGYAELEKEELEFLFNLDIKGGRQHYLCFTADTLAFWQNAGFKYDSTLGFSYHTGYRCGASMPFPLHDGEKALPILEIPLVLMDTVLFLESKQFLSATDAWLVIEQHLEETARNNGLLTINWHNSDLHPYDVYGYSQLYIKILQWVRARNGWLGSLNQVYDWWVSK